MTARRLPPLVMLAFVCATAAPRSAAATTQVIDVTVKLGAIPAFLRATVGDPDQVRRSFGWRLLTGAVGFDPADLASVRGAGLGPTARVTVDVDDDAARIDATALPRVAAWRAGGGAMLVVTLDIDADRLPLARRTLTAVMAKLGAVTQLPTQAAWSKRLAATGVTQLAQSGDRRVVLLMSARATSGPGAVRLQMWSRLDGGPVEVSSLSGRAEVGRALARGAVQSAAELVVEASARGLVAWADATRFGDALRRREKLPTRASCGRLRDTAARSSAGLRAPRVQLRLSPQRNGLVGRLLFRGDLRPMFGGKDAPSVPAPNPDAVASLGWSKLTMTGTKAFARPVRTSAELHGLERECGAAAAAAVWLTMWPEVAALIARELRAMGAGASAMTDGARAGFVEAQRLTGMPFEWRSRGAVLLDRAAAKPSRRLLDTLYPAASRRRDGARTLFGNGPLVATHRPIKSGALVAFDWRARGASPPRALAEHGFVTSRSTVARMRLDMAALVAAGVAVPPPLTGIFNAALLVDNTRTELLFQFGPR